MKKMINEPENIVEEMVNGMLKAYPEYLERVKDLQTVGKGLWHLHRSLYESLFPDIVGECQKEKSLTGQDWK